MPDFFPYIFIVYTCIINFIYSKHVCIYDDIKLSNTLKGSISSYSNVIHSRKEREVIGVLFEPLRLNISYQIKDVELLDDVIFNVLKKALNDVKLKVESTFKVQRQNDILLLKRSKCQTVWSSGINKGKCHKVRDSYKGEECLDGFILPDVHLEGLYIYNSSYSEPIEEKYSRGSGVQYSDFILYITSSYTNHCIGTKILAYASHCKLDTSNNNRPIAGQIHLCPSLLSNNYDKIYTTVLHEIMHTLGFSPELMQYFSKCDEGNNCTVHDKPISDDNYLITPKVQEMAQKHWNCSEPNFGVKLQVLKNNKLGSHWDGAFMYSSLMAPNIDEPELTVLDPLTLALFQDTGWYEVNFEESETYTWGKNQKCSFASQDNCQSSSHTTSEFDYFCSKSGELGCHYTSQWVSSCQNEQSMGECMVYRPDTGSKCQSGEICMDGVIQNKTANITFAECVPYDCDGEIHQQLSQCDRYFRGNDPNKFYRCRHIAESCQRIDFVETTVVDVELEDDICGEEQSLFQYGLKFNCFSTMMMSSMIGDDVILEKVSNVICSSANLKNCSSVSGVKLTKKETIEGHADISTVFRLDKLHPNECRDVIYQTLHQKVENSEVIFTWLQYKYVAYHIEIIKTNDDDGKNKGVIAAISIISIIVVICIAFLYILYRRKVNLCHIAKH